MNRYSRQKICLFLLAFLIAPLAQILAKETILLTGGAGYIGSHIAVVLLQNDYHVVIVDNLINSEHSAIANIEAIAKKPVDGFYQYDLIDQEHLRHVFQTHKIDAVIHLAGFKAVGESVENPLAYYRNNLISTISLLEVMKEYDCHRLLFSSSATVYGAPTYLPIDENHPVGPTSPYGRTKLMIEEILKDVAAQDAHDHFISLRYFNPIGAHPSGLIGEKPNGIPQNLMPFILQVAQGKRPYLTVYGDDYNTADGTAIRDYIHVMDVAEGHILALKSLFSNESGYRVYNLGTGVGYSVKEMIDAVSHALGYPLPYKVSARRQGDVDALVANPAKAQTELGFTATRTLEDMVQDSLTWGKNVTITSPEHK